MKNWIPVLVAVCSVIIIFSLVIVAVAKLTKLITEQPTLSAPTPHQIT
jgi:predicted Na+-dependent transporter